MIIPPLTPSRSKTRTRDMGGDATTHQFTKAILDKMETL
jgi:isocitrate dehydrogenase (NAD+)